MLICMQHYMCRLDAISKCNSNIASLNASLRYAVSNLSTIWEHAVDVERLTRTAQRLASQGASPHPEAEETKLLSKVQQGLAKIQGLTLKLQAALSAAEGAETDVHPPVLLQVFDATCAKVQVSVLLISVKTHT